MRLRSSKKTESRENGDTDHLEELEIRPKVRQAKKRLTYENTNMSEPEHIKDANHDGSDGDNHITLFGHRFNTAVLFVHINIALYSMCFWIQQGVIPYLTKTLGVDAVVYGYLQTTFAVVQLCGGPIFGRFGDLFGGRAALTLAFSASTLSYLLLGISNSVPLLFLSRLPSIFMHAMQGGQMVVTDVSDEKERAGALAKLGLSYGCGMVVGPVLGGVLVKLFGLQNAAFCAAFGSMLSIFLVMKYIPQYTKPKEHIAQDVSGSQVFSIHKYLKLMSIPGVLFLLFYRLVSGIPIGVFQSMFTVIAMETFKLPPEQNGLILSYVAVVTMLVQGFGITVMTKRFSDNSLLTWASFLLIWAYLGLSMVQSIWQLVIVILPMVCGLATITIVVSSALTKLVTVADTGVMLGLNMALNSAIRSVSPTVGGIMLEYWGFPSIGYFGFINSTFLAVLLFFKFRGQ